MTGSKNGHRRRFANWCKLGGRSFTTLARLVEARLTPPVIELGFHWVDAYGWDSSLPVIAREIRLERRIATEIQAVTFSFDKYHRPAFQVLLTCRMGEPPHESARYAVLTRFAGQYVCFWGKPWWLPTRLWSDRASDRVVARVAGHLGQALAFLDHGTRGSNISRPIGPRGTAPFDGPSANP